MPWDIREENGKQCVYKKTNGKTLHCYSDKAQAEAYLKALYANASHSEKELDPGVYVSKETDGRYRITAISTAATPDKEKETFSTEAIDYDIALAKQTGEYPEFRVFHNSKLGIGKVEKMSRVGIFAVDEGHSYDDPFSQQVCEKMLSSNDGKWRVSRGFYLLEASLGCPKCKEQLVITQKHMAAGFRCPTCDHMSLSYKGLDNVRFRKTKTVEDTVTDIPCVPYTGVAAVPMNKTEELHMNKKDLKQKLLDAGIDEDAIEARLKEVTDEQLKELSDVPFAQVLKEFTPETDEVEEDETVTMESVLKEIRAVVKDELKSALEGLEIDVPDFKGMEVEFKEVPGIVELKEAVEALTEKVDAILAKDEAKIQKQIADMPRNGKLRILRSKAKKPDPNMDAEDMTDEGGDEETEGEMPMTPKKVKKSADGYIPDANGNTFGSMTEFITGGGAK